MGEKAYFQPLTREDRITVILYRAGIFLSTLVIAICGYLALEVGRGDPEAYPWVASGLTLNVLLLILYFGVGLSVFFIHLYVGKFHRILKKIYYVAVGCLAVLFLIGNGNPVIPLFRTPPISSLLLIPISLCLGFVTAKEAFCFRLFEGYLLAVIMPAYLFFYAVGALSPGAAIFGLMLIAVMLFFFMLRKIFMPVAFDIGDKSAYQP
ncbi:MAG: DUF2301 domain-containing membrane protein [Candidatus Sulfobium sp.]|jgi:uncharacterized integral membrane protein